MGLRCLIGHDYGEPQTSRDRAERGNEVVVTVREYRECTRCGHRRVISENKEVTAGPTAADDSSAEAAWTPGEDPGADQPTAEGFDRSSDGPAEVEASEPMSAAEDDGIILEDEPEEPRRAHGEWPDDHPGEAPAEPVEEHAPWPDEAPAPEPSEPSEPERPDPDDDPLDVGPEATGVADEPSAGTADATGGTGAAGAGHGDSRSSRPGNTDTEFVCPDCGETWPTRNASLRPGDICPACRRGYLQEQLVQ